MFLRAASALESRGAQGLESLAGKRREVRIPAAGPAAGVGPAHGEPGQWDSLQASAGKSCRGQPACLGF